MLLIALLGGLALVAGAAQTPGLLLHWTFDGATAADRLKDSSGNGLHAAINGTESAVSWALGIVGEHALKLSPVWDVKESETSQGMVCPFLRSPSLRKGIRGVSPFTLAFWVKPDLPVTFVAGRSSWIATMAFINGRVVETWVTQANFGDAAQLFLGYAVSQMCYSGLLDDVRLYTHTLASSDVYDLWRGICNGTGFFLPEGARTAPCEAFRCPAGTADSDGDSSTACVAGAAGQYAPAGAGSCADCAAGATDSDGDPSTPCVACGPGHTVPGTATAGPCSALACAAGWTDDDWDTSTACVQCGAGTEAPAGSSGPCAGLACRAGFVDDDSDPATPCASVCAPLATPELCNASADGCGWCYTRCAPLSPLCNPGCPAGTTGIGYNATTPCRPCGPGAYVPAGSVGLCPLFACPSGTADTDSDPSTPCAPSPAGSYAQPATAGPCPACPAGSTDHDGNSSTQCVACGAGAFVPRGSSGPCSLFACPDGLFDNDSDPSTPCASSCLLIAMPVVCYDSVYGCEWCGSACAPAGGCGIVVKHPPTSDGLVLHWSFEVK
eukprot:m51a1_g14073 putative protein serine threonine (554) ;mRNA; r:1273671-1279189